MRLFNFFIFLILFGFPPPPMLLQVVALKAREQTKLL